MEEDTTFHEFQLRECALSRAVNLQREGDTTLMLIDRAKAFYDFLSNKKPDESSKAFF